LWRFGCSRYAILTESFIHTLRTSNMDNYEKWGYTLLAIIAALYIVALFIGIISTFPFGLIGLLLIAGIGILLVKVLKERMKNKEDDYYSREIDR
jgi:F0F1-type ATP synthase assembly protein I